MTRVFPKFFVMCILLACLAGCTAPPLKENVSIQTTMRTPTISDTNQAVVTTQTSTPLIIISPILPINLPQNQSNTTTFRYVRGSQFQYQEPRTSSSIYEIRVWIFGDDFISPSTVQIDARNSFVRSLTWDERKKLNNLFYSSFLLIVQYPKERDQFDINFKTTADTVTIIKKESEKVFSNITMPYDKNWMSSELLLKQALNEDGVSDTFKEYSVIIEEPWIRIDPVSDHKIGGKFEISGTTNLPEGEELYVEVVPLSLLEKKSQCQCTYITGGATGTIRVLKGTNAINHWIFSFDTSSFTPEKYIIAVYAVYGVCQAEISINFTAAE